jgi:hypothetical protein
VCGLGLGDDIEISCVVSALNICSLVESFASAASSPVVMLQNVTWFDGSESRDSHTPRDARYVIRRWEWGLLDLLAHYGSVAHTLS